MSWVESSRSERKNKPFCTIFTPKYSQKAVRLQAERPRRHCTDPTNVGGYQGLSRCGVDGPPPKSLAENTTNCGKDHERTDLHATDLCRHSGALQNLILYSQDTNTALGAHSFEQHTRTHLHIQIQLVGTRWVDAGAAHCDVFCSSLLAFCVSLVKRNIVFDN